MVRPPVLFNTVLVLFLLASTFGCGGGADGASPARAAADTAASGPVLPPIAGDAPTRFPVQIDGAWGYVDREGELVVEPRFERAKGFYENRAAVQIDGAWGYIDTTGAVAIEPRFGSAGRFSEGLAAVAPEGRGPHGYVDPTGEMVIPPDFPVTYESVQDRHFRDGLAPTQKANPKGQDPFGFIDREGSWAIEARFRTAQPFGEGLAAVKIWNTEGWAYVDTAGTAVLEVPWDRVRPFSGGLAAVDTADGFGGAWRYMDRTGEIVLRPTFGSGTSAPDRAESFSEGLALIYYDGPRQHIYITPSGENADFLRVERYRWFDEATSFRGDRARVMVQGHDEFVYIDRAGEVIWPRPDRAGDGTEEGEASDAAPEPEIDTCGDTACFEAAVVACRPARYRTGSFMGGRAVYEVRGSDGDGCRLQLTYTANPNPSWVDTPLLFTLGPAEGAGSTSLTPRLRAAVEACLTGTDAASYRCGGPLARELGTAAGEPTASPSGGS